MFKDEAQVRVIAGRGGDGCMSFRREAYVPKGGPDGGDGGRGGDVIFVADNHVNSLLDLVRRRKIKAAAGKPGRGRNQSGKGAEDVVIKVPVGTIFYDAETGDQLCDLSQEKQEFIAVKGGKGGRGNQHFATATHQTPREFEYGTPGQERELRLELKLIADIGLVGFPNAGKSTLLSVCSAARPKIAGYPFTTLAPQLGIVEVDGFTFVMADIPGLIEGASEGKGLGHQFLRHIERTRAIVHMLDMSSGEVDELVQQYRTIRGELDAFSTALAEKREIIVGNKVDDPDAAERIEPLSKELGTQVLPLSAVAHMHLKELLRSLASFVRQSRAEELERQESEKTANDSGV